MDDVLTLHFTDECTDAGTDCLEKTLDARGRHAGCAYSYVMRSGVWEGNEERFGGERRGAEDGGCLWRNVVGCCGGQGEWAEDEGGGWDSRRGACESCEDCKGLVLGGWHALGTRGGKFSYMCRLGYERMLLRAGKTLRKGRWLGDSRLPA